MIPAFEAIKAINDVRGEAIVVGTMTPNRYWELVTERPELDLPVFGAMGKASSLGLGVALAQPDRTVLVLDGDGALLMNLGTLVTIAGQQPPNLFALRIRGRRLLHDRRPADSRRRPPQLRGDGARGGNRGKP